MTDTDILQGSFGPAGTSVIGSLGVGPYSFLGAMSAEATQAEYDALAVSDGIWLQTPEPGVGDNAFVQFVFQAGLTAVELPLVGSVSFAMEGRQGDPNADDWYIYLWDFSGSQYLRLSETTGNPPGEVQDPPDEARAATITAGSISMNGYLVGLAGDLIDATTGRLVGLAVNMDTSDWIRIDAASATLQVVPGPNSLLPVSLGLMCLSVARRLRR